MLPILRSMTKVEGFRSQLMSLHDELADCKSYFDGHLDDEQLDPVNLGIINFVMYINEASWGNLKM